MAKHRQDKGRIDLAMRKTFPDHRRKIVMEMAVIDDIVTDYPQLTDIDEVIDYFCRLTFIIFSI